VDDNVQMKYILLMLSLNVFISSSALMCLPTPTLWCVVPMYFCVLMYLWKLLWYGPCVWTNHLLSIFQPNSKMHAVVIDDVDNRAMQPKRLVTIFYAFMHHKQIKWSTKLFSSDSQNIVVLSYNICAIGKIPISKDLSQEGSCYLSRMATTWMILSLRQPYFIQAA